MPVVAGHCWIAAGVLLVCGATLLCGCSTVLASGSSATAADLAAVADETILTGILHRSRHAGPSLPLHYLMLLLLVVCALGKPAAGPDWKLVEG